MNQDYRKRAEEFFDNYFDDDSQAPQFKRVLELEFIEVAQEARRKTFELCIRLCKSYWQIDPEDEGSGKWAMKQMVGCLEKYLE